MRILGNGTMSIHELRDPEIARQFVVQGLRLQRVVLPTVSSVRPALEWALELAANGQPLPPSGFIADLAHVLLGTDRGGPVLGDAPGTQVLPGGLLRTYEDLVLGKIFADRAIERAGDAVRRYQGRNRARGIAFVLDQIRERSGIGGVLLNPAILKALIDTPPGEILASSAEAVNDGLQPLLVELYNELIASFRRMADILGPEDVFELEHGTALAELGQRVALRQTLQTAAMFEAGLSKHKPRPKASPREVPTRVLDEDTYPVGGFASISTRGTIESLLHSQLAFMEPPTAPRPDLFDIKFVRDELLYYSRDENQFFRRRRGFVILLQPDLVRARFKDLELPTQRIVLILSMMAAMIRKLTEWLSADALAFDIVFVAEGENQPLAQEESLLAMLFCESIANGTVRLARVSDVDAARQIVNERARRSLCEAIVVGTMDATLPDGEVSVARFVVDGPRPRLYLGDSEAMIDADNALVAWQQSLERLLEAWA
jgi:vWA domain found in the FtsH ternary systems/N-terminal helical region fused to the FtsH ternary system vWA domain